MSRDPNRGAAPRRAEAARALLSAAALAVVTLAVFSPAVRNGFVSLDDAPYVTENPEVKAGLRWEGIRWAFATTREANWHPLTWISHMADVSVWGLDPSGHHLVNVLLHAANAGLLLLVLFQMTGRLGASAAAAALFAVHPLRVESVAWVAERKDLLAAFFGLLALHAWVHFVKDGRAGYAASILFLAASLLAKPMLVTFPFLLLLLDFWPLGRFGRGALGRLLLEKVPFFALSAASCAVTLWAQAGARAGESLPFSARASNALVSLAAYVGSSLAPFSLSVLYPHPGRAIAAAWPAAALVVAVSAAALASAKRRPYLAVGWFWYVGTLVPVLGLVQVGWQARADRYTYLPSIGLAIAAAWGLSDPLGSSRFGARLLPVLAGAAAAFFAILTLRQIGYWKDSATLYTRGLAVTEKNPVLRVNLGIERMREGRQAEAIGEFERAVADEPRYWYGQLALGKALSVAGRAAEGVPHLEAAYAMRPDSEEARRALEEARPAAVREHFEAARARLSSGRPADAKQELREALRLSPADRPAATLLAAMLATSGDATPAEAAEALRLARGLVEASGGRDPNDLDLLAAAQAQAGSFSEAVATAERAVALADAAGQKNLSRVIVGRLAFYRGGKPYRSGG